MAAAAFLMSGRASGFRFDLGRIYLDMPSPPLGTLRFLRLTTVTLGLFTRALSPSLGATGLLFLLTACFVVLLLSPTPLATSFILRAAGLLGSRLCRSSFGSFFLGTTGTAGGAARFSLGIFLLTSPPCIRV
jgi:hypothetical protein